MRDHSWEDQDPGHHIKWVNTLSGAGLGDASAGQEVGVCARMVIDVVLVSLYWTTTTPAVDRGSDSLTVNQVHGLAGCDASSVEC